MMNKINIELLTDEEAEGLLFKASKVPSWEVSNTQSEHEHQLIRIAKRQQEIERQREADEERKRQHQLILAQKILNEKQQTDKRRNNQKRRIKEQKKDEGLEL